MRLIALDTETTGLFADSGDRIIEIGCVELVNRKRTGRNWHHYLNPGRDSHADAFKVHGISNEFLFDKPAFSAVADELLRYLEGAEVVIHNASFDVGFLDSELKRAGRLPLQQHVIRLIDTLAMAKEIYPGKRNSLDALCDRLGVDRSARTQHGALLDAELLADVYICLTRGQDGLLMDSSPSGEQQGSALDQDLSKFSLAVLAADHAELAAHEDLLQQLDRASGGATVWRRLSELDESAVA